MLILKIAIDLICGVLFAWGGFNFLPARRFILPTVLAITISILLHIWWIGILVLPVCGTLCLGYSGSKSGFRGFWLFLQAVVISVGFLLTRHLGWYLFFPYCVVSGILGATLYNLEQIIGDIIFGCWLGIILFLVH